jgi:hypothetical protein
MSRPDPGFLALDAGPPSLTEKAPHERFLENAGLSVSTILFQPSKLLTAFGGRRYITVVFDRRDSVSGAVIPHPQTKDEPGGAHGRP